MILQFQQQPRGLLDAVFHADEEGGGFLAVDDAVVVAQREIHHRADDDLTLVVRLLNQFGALHVPEVMDEDDGASCEHDQHQSCPARLEPDSTISPQTISTEAMRYPSASYLGTPPT